MIVRDRTGVLNFLYMKGRTVDLTGQSEVRSYLAVQYCLVTNLLG